MLRGIVTIKCPACGTVFQGPDIEWQASALSAPVHCPHCGHSCNPGTDRAGIIDSIIGKVRFIREVMATKKANDNSAVFFQPWVGCNYNSGGIFGKRIMVLGESHYCGEGCKDCGNTTHSECRHFTAEVIRSYLDPNAEREGWMSTYLKFERSLVNHETASEESVRIWNSLLFYNYLQVAMQGPRQAGTQEQYKSAAEPFFSVMNQYQPELLIVWGVRLWHNLPSARWEEGPSMVIDGIEVSNGYYKLGNGRKVRAICVYHPSSGYSWDYWYKVINK